MKGFRRIRSRGRMSSNSNNNFVGLGDENSSELPDGDVPSLVVPKAESFGSELSMGSIASRDREVFQLLDQTIAEIKNETKKRPSTERISDEDEEDLSPIQRVVEGDEDEENDDDDDNSEFVAVADMRRTNEATTTPGISYQAPSSPSPPATAAVRAISFNRLALQHGAAMPSSVASIASLSDPNNIEQEQERGREEQGNGGTASDAVGLPARSLVARGSSISEQLSSNSVSSTGSTIGSFVDWSRAGIVLGCYLILTRRIPFLMQLFVIKFAGVAALCYLSTIPIHTKTATTTSSSAATARRRIQYEGNLLHVVYSRKTFWLIAYVVIWLGSFWLVPAFGSLLFAASSTASTGDSNQVSSIQQQQQKMKAATLRTFGSGLFDSTMTVTDIRKQQEGSNTKKQRQSELEISEQRKSKETSQNSVDTNQSTSVLSAILSPSTTSSNKEPSSSSVNEKAASNKKSTSPSTLSESSGSSSSSSSSSNRNSRSIRKSSASSTQTSQRNNNNVNEVQQRSSPTSSHRPPTSPIFELQSSAKKNEKQRMNRLLRQDPAAGILDGLVVEKKTVLTIESSRNSSGKNNNPIVFVVQNIVQKFQTIIVNNSNHGANEASVEEKNLFRRWWKTMSYHLTAFFFGVNCECPHQEMLDDLASNWYEQIWR